MSRRLTVGFDAGGGVTGLGVCGKGIGCGMTDSSRRNVKSTHVAKALMTMGRQLVVGMGEEQLDGLELD